jgi:2OG-Fe(II) oxygenase superfamily
MGNSCIPSFIDDKIAVLDSVLSLAAFADLWTYVQRDEYEIPARHDNWVKVWRLGDGPLVSSRDRRLSHGPFASALDAFSGALLSIAEQHPDLVGERGVDWQDISIRSYLYPRGSKLSWHDDMAGNSGAFSFYAHPTWGSTWGGELMIAETAGYEAVKAASETGPHLDHSWEDQYLIGHGRGMFISPKPNRLVLLAPNVYHAINRVDADAGDHARCAIAGFFLQVPMNGSCDDSNQ